VPALLKLNKLKTEYAPDAIPDTSAQNEPEQNRKGNITKIVVPENGSVYYVVSFPGDSPVHLSAENMADTLLNRFLTPVDQSEAIAV
jgi:hypothetical protein